MAESEFTNGAHAAVDAMINMFTEINKTPIFGAVKYGTKVLETNGDRFISLENVIELLNIHRQQNVKQLNKSTTRIEDATNN